MFINQRNIQYIPNLIWHIKWILLKDESIYLKHNNKISNDNVRIYEYNRKHREA